MDDYKITFARSARKELEILDTQVVGRIFPKIQMLSKTPRPHGSRKLQAEKNHYRIRVGNYRVIYSIDDNSQVVDIVRIRHRSEAYQ